VPAKIGKFLQKLVVRSSTPVSSMALIQDLNVELSYSLEISLYPIADKCFRRMSAFLIHCPNQKIIRQGLQKFCVNLKGSKINAIPSNEKVPWLLN